MDKVRRTADIARSINKFNSGEIEDHQLIENVCAYFDSIKTSTLSTADKKLLVYISNRCGIPQYYDMLKVFNGNVDLAIDSETLGLQSLSAFLYESTLFSTSSKLHRYQKEILEKFKPNQLNRFFLSASTSFGKTHLVFEIISKMDYKNVVLIFPTIALLSENLEKLLSTRTQAYNYFRTNYRIHTLSEVKDFGERNLFIYTPERFLSFLEKNPKKVKFDFAFVDEVYKIDNEYIIDEESKENERDTAYRLAVYYALDKNVDVLLAGPYVEFYRKNQKGYNSSFDNFMNKNSIELINFNKYEIVDKSYDDIITKNEVNISNEFEFNFEDKSKKKRLIEVTKKLTTSNQNVIIYCPEIGKRGGVERYANDLINSGHFISSASQKYSDIIAHISENYPKDWIVVKALTLGIGIHHGLVPKYIQKEIINLFNDGLINILLSTTTITEGVNTSAKNLIVMLSKKGDKKLRKFDAKNIAGRAGRFGYHYSGRVLALDPSFLRTIDSKEDGIKHKNYDIKSKKKEIDLFYTNDEYLSEEDKLKKLNIKRKQEQRGIPDEIISQYKVISRNDKIDVYDTITKLSNDSFEQLDKLFYAVKLHTSISFEGFDVVLKVLRPIVRNKEVERLIDTTVFNEKKKREFPVLCSLVFAYLQNGFKGSVDYKKKNQGKDTDKAMSETSKFIYNTLKYQIVKYLGVFNVMYKFHISKTTGKNFEDIAGFDKLLLKFEYNALTDEGRIASDYGVPYKVLEYFENPDDSQLIQNKFDAFEKKLFKKVNEIIKSNKK